MMSILIVHESSAIFAGAFGQSGPMCGPQLDQAAAKVAAALLAHCV